MEALLSFNEPDNLQKLLNSPSTILEDVLDEESVVQELKQVNNELVNFLLQDQNFDKLVSYVCGVPAENVNKNYPLCKENKNTKYPFIACELLCANNEQINKFFLGLSSSSQPASPVSNETETETKVSANLIKFMDVLNSPTPIDFTVVGYFAKIFKVLFQAEGKHMSYVLYQHNPQYLKQLLEHIYSDSIQEILLMVVKLDAHYFRSVGGDHYLNQRLELVEAIFLGMFPDPKRNEDFDISSQRQINCSTILCLIITGYSCFSNGKNILNSFLTLEKISQVLKGLLNQTVVQAVVPLISHLCNHYRDLYSSKDKLPLLDLIRYTECVVKPNIPDTEPLIVATVETLDNIIETLKNEKCSLQPKQGQENNIHSDFNPNQRKVGIIETIHNILKLQNAQIDKKIVEINGLTVILDMFVKNPWNSILHSNLHKVFAFVVEHGSAILKESLFEGAKILDFIAAEAKEPEVQVHIKTGNKTKKSYIAHLNIIANLIEKSEDSFVKNICNNHEGWQEFKNNALKKENEKNKGLVDYPPPKPYEGVDKESRFGNGYSNSPIHNKLDAGFNNVYVTSPTQIENEKEVAKNNVEEEEPDATPKSSKRLGWGDF